MCVSNVYFRFSETQYQHTTARHGTAEHSTAQHSTVQHDTAQSVPLSRGWGWGLANSCSSVLANCLLPSYHQLGWHTLAGYRLDEHGLALWTHRVQHHTCYTQGTHWAAGSHAA